MFMCLCVSVSIYSLLACHIDNMTLEFIDRCIALLFLRASIALGGVAGL